MTSPMPNQKDMGLLLRRSMYNEAFICAASLHCFGVPVQRIRLPEHLRKVLTAAVLASTTEWA